MTKHLHAPHLPLTSRMDEAAITTTGSFRLASLSQRLALVKLDDLVVRRQEVEEYNLERQLREHCPDRNDTYAKHLTVMNEW